MFQFTAATFCDIYNVSLLANIAETPHQIFAILFLYREYVTQYLAK